MSDKPFSDRCSNPESLTNNWTCCACYHDLGNVGPGKHECTDCGETIVCTIETVRVLVTEVEG